MVTTISHLNNLIAETTEANLFVTSFTCILNMDKGEINYVNAGHNSPFILRGKEVIKLDEGSLAVGLFPDVPFTVAENQLKPNDIMVLYTDGIVEAENPEGEQYSFDGLVEFIKKNREYNAKEIKELVIKELEKYTKNTHFEDDITFIIIKCI